MPTFLCRAKAPKATNWFEQEAATPEEAANSFHESKPHIVDSLGIEDKGTKVRFALIEVQDHGEWVSRVYVQGIWRAGGVKPRHQNTLSDIAKALGWERDPQELLEPGWDFEETQEAAEKRKWG